MKRLACLGLAGLTVLLSAFPASAEEIRSGTNNEAWYSTSSLCGVPAACGSAVTVTSYPADTLHVGVSGGQEQARTYLSFGFATHPTGTTTTGAILRLPVATDAGSNNVDQALLQACLVPGGLPSPSPTAAPATDCSATSPATYLPGTPDSFEIDLQPLLRSHREELNGLTLAILPGTLAVSAAVPPSWHVAFSGRNRKAPGAVAISAQVSYSVPPLGTVASPPPASPTLAGPLPSAPALQAISPQVAVVQASAPAVVAAPQAPAFPGVAPRAQLVPRSFTIKGRKFGMVWALPLLLFGLGWSILSTGGRDLRSYAQVRALT